MRWLYRIPSTAQEESSHRATLQSIDRWWTQFAAQSKQILRAFSRQSDIDLPAFMHENLDRIATNLFWEFGPALRGEGQRLVITPESHKQLRPLARTIIERAPQLPGWEFYAHRPPEDLEMTHQTVEGRTGTSIQGAKVTVAAGDARRIDLKYYFPHCASDQDEQAFHQALIATETLLGEEVMDAWVGAIEVAPLKKAPTRKPPAPLDLDRLAPTVDALIRSLRDQLPAGSWCDSPPSASQEMLWSGIEIRSPESQEYPDCSDLLVAITPDTDLWSAAHESTNFYSHPFSRAGETFCYLKIQAPDRDPFEEALDAALVPAKLGCVIGGGTGRAYSYSDLALTNLPKSIPLLRQILQRAKIPRRSWLLFFDCELTDEWVGIWDDTPPPPPRATDGSDDT